MTWNAFFPAPAPSLATVTAAIEDLSRRGDGDLVGTCRRRSEAHTTVKGLKPGATVFFRARFSHGLAITFSEPSPPLK
jgi:hypothetical protein